MSKVVCQFCQKPSSFKYLELCDDTLCHGLYNGTLAQGTTAAAKDPRVVAIRCDKVVGLGSCTVPDECYDDNDLVEGLDDEKVTTPAAAVRWARELQGMHLENACNARWGADDDPQLDAMRSFRKLCAE